MKRFAILMLLIGTAGLTHAQFVVSGNTVVAQKNDSRIIIRSSGNVVNETSNDFEEAMLSLQLNGGNQTIQGTWNLDSLRAIAGSDKFVDGNVVVTNGLDLRAGIVNVSDDVTLRFIGDDAGVTQSNDSYITGILYQRGGGERFYPIGNDAGYAPLTFVDQKLTSEDVGVTSFSGTFPYVKTGINIKPGYWEILVSDPTDMDTKVRLPKPELNEGEAAIVVQEKQNSANSLGGTSPAGSTTVESTEKVKSKYLATASSNEVRIIIKELITPQGSSQSEVNDALEILNVEAVFNVQIKLLDRYGIVVKTWDFKGTDVDGNPKNVNEGLAADASFFETLSPGHYICIVEYNEPGVGDTLGKRVSVSQMVTILKTR